MRTNIIAIANQKGGVGKTATAVNLAASYAHLGKKTLLIDFDYQGNATANFGLKLRAKDEGKTASQALKNNLKLADVIIRTKDKNLDIIAGDMGLSKMSREQILDPGAAVILKNWISQEANGSYDIIIIDTHPSLDLLFQMAMTASHYYLVPMFAEADPFDGLQYMFEEISQIKSRINKQLFFLGIVITKFDKSNATHKKFHELLTEFGAENKIAFRGLIPDSQAVASSSSIQRPLLWHLEHLPITKAYVDVAKSLLPELKGARQGRTQHTPKITGTPTEIAQLFGEVQNAEIF